MINVRKSTIYFISACFFFLATMTYAQQGLYTFCKDRGLTYEFRISGDIIYKMAGIESQNYKVETRGLLKMDLLEAKEDVHVIKLIPSKTFVKLNDMILEDITTQETAISQLISTSIIEIKKNGEIISSKEVTSGIVDMSQTIRLIPAFPEKLSSGKRWKQYLSSFNIPGLPMCNLAFLYLYIKENNNSAKVQLIANQPIKEEKKEGDIIMTFTGKNSSSGEFGFDEDKGEIKRFTGKFGLLLNVVFSLPPGPGKERSSQQTMPLNLDVKLDVQMWKK